MLVAETATMLGRLAPALVIVAACGGGPRYADRSPPLPAPTGCDVDADEVAVTSTGSTQWTVANPPKAQAMGEGESYNAMTVTTRGTHVSRGVVVAPYPDVALAPNLIAPQRDVPPATRVGDVRTRDHRVDAATYSQLLCGWTGEAEPADRDSCRLIGQPAMTALLADLKRETASVQADLVHDVRCFGRNEGTYLRVWCEGTAYLTRAHAVNHCPR